MYGMDVLSVDDRRAAKSTPIWRSAAEPTSPRGLLGQRFLEILRTEECSITWKGWYGGFFQ